MTPVQWLDRWFRDNPEATHEEGNKALEQALEMEKQQRFLDYNVGYNDASCNHINDAEQYIHQSTNNI